MTDWRARAACRGRPTELFFAEYGGDHYCPEARMLCEVCPVRAECLEWALDRPERHGVWGGTSEQERVKLRRRRRAAELRRLNSRLEAAS